MEKNTKMNTEKATGLGAIVATVATAGVAAVGYYFYASKDAVKHRKVASKWAKSFKDDVLKQARKVKAFDQKMLTMVITEAGKKYEMLKSVDKAELAKAMKELKTNWHHVIAELQKGVKKTVKATTKSAISVKKTVNKVVKNATKKK